MKRGNILVTERKSSVHSFFAKISQNQPKSAKISQNQTDGTPKKKPRQVLSQNPCHSQWCCSKIYAPVTIHGKKYHGTESFPHHSALYWRPDAAFALNHDDKVQTFFRPPPGQLSHRFNHASAGTETLVLPIQRLALFCIRYKQN